MNELIDYDFENFRSLRYTLSLLTTVTTRRRIDVVDFEVGVNIKSVEGGGGWCLVSGVSEFFKIVTNLFVWNFVGRHKVEPSET